RTYEIGKRERVNFDQKIEAVQGGIGARDQLQTCRGRSYEANHPRTEARGIANWENWSSNSVAENRA
uniref:hypothetical protein n=1 Tax=Sporosarcina sp. 6E9 TaxID=2819235 RepID=UPI001B314CFA